MCAPAPALATHSAAGAATDVTLRNSSLCRQPPGALQGFLLTVPPLSGGAVVLTTTDTVVQCASMSDSLVGAG